MQDIEWIPASEILSVIQESGIRRSYFDRAVRGLQKERIRGEGLALFGGDYDFAIRRDSVQDLLSSGELHLKDEPTSQTDIKLFGSPEKFLEKYQLRRPK